MAFRRKAGAWLAGPCLSLRGPRTLGTRAALAPKAVLPFEAIPQSRSNTWMKTLQIWKDQGYENLHLDMQQNFQELGPIFRYDIGGTPRVSVMLPEDVERLQQVETLHPRRMCLDPWLAYRHHRGHKCGVFLLNQSEYQTLRSVSLGSHVPCGGGSRAVAETCAGHFALRGGRAMSCALGSTHCTALVAMFPHGCWGSSVQVRNRGSEKVDAGPGHSQSFPEAAVHHGALGSQSSGKPLPWEASPGQGAGEHRCRWLLVLCSQELSSRWGHCLGMYHSPGRGRKVCLSPSAADGLPLGQEGLKDGRGQLTATTHCGEVDSLGNSGTTFPLLMTLFELARNPQVQQALRQESLEAATSITDNPQRAMVELPLLRAALKETLRLYPVGVNLERLLTSDVVLQNYHIPAGTLVQVFLPSLGRNPASFPRPERYDPHRWLDIKGSSTKFRHLAFGFGVRQCLGRRLAEVEMVLLLHHVLKNFLVETLNQEDVRMAYRFTMKATSFPALSFRAVN
uniref:steroid 11beta-monooxygenase n=1 Tax=Otolemur garnettii TaxID=30611 RepID=H0WZ55_OTOGA